MKQDSPKKLISLFWPSRFLVLAMSIWGLTSCSTQSNKPLAVEEEMNKITGSAKPATIPDVINDAIASAAAGSLPAEIRFDVAVNNVPASSFFYGLAADSGINVVTDPAIEGSISLQLKNVTLDDVLNVTRDMFGYEYRKQNGIYTIYAKKMRTEVFSINYLDVNRRGVTDTQVVTGAGSEKKQSSGGQNSTGNSTESQAQQKGDSGSQNGRAQGSSGTRVITTNKADFWENLQSTLEGILGDSSDGRSVTVNPQSGLVIVKALPKDINAVRNFLERSELSVKRQVILETKILEVRLNDGYQSGVNWDAISGQLSYGFNLAEGFSLGAEKPITSRYKKSGGLNEKNGGTFASIVQINDITKLISLLETQGDVQVLSSPRISTVNNQKAVIRVGSDEYFVTGVSNSTTASAASTTTTPDIDLSSFFSGISMDVTPQIAENSDVILHVHPMVSDVKDQQKTFTVGSQDFSLPMALRDIRESDSVVRAKSGQVVVLGGLMQHISRKQNGKRPILGDVPLVNTFFKTKNSMGTKTELVILLRPIVVDDKAWQEQLNDTAERFKTLGDSVRER